MRLLISLAALALPFIEILLLVRLGSVNGWLPFVWVILAVLAGWALIWQERKLFVVRVLGALQANAGVSQMLWQSGRRFIAGVLLVIPGILTDVAALVLLLWPGARLPRRAAANDDIIEGTFRRDPTSRLENKD